MRKKQTAPHAMFLFVFILRALFLFLFLFMAVSMIPWETIQKCLVVLRRTHRRL
jgi:hypothetical protein